MSDKKPTLTADHLNDLAKGLDETSNSLRAECSNYEDGAPLLGHAITALTGASEVLKNQAKIMVKAVALIVALCLLGMSASAQVFYGGVTVIGTSNAPVQVNFANLQGYASITCPSRTLQLQNTASNEVYVLGYYGNFSGMGGTNLYLLGALTNTLPGAGWTPGTVFTTNIPAQTFQVPITAWGQIAISNNIYTSVTNVVLLQ
jgi:hypothetical protein